MDLQYIETIKEAVQHAKESGHTEQRQIRVMCESIFSMNKIEIDEDEVMIQMDI